MFGNPRKSIEVGKPRNEAERKKVNKRLKNKYGYEEHFGAPKRKETLRTKSVSDRLKAAGLSQKEIDRLRGGQ